MENTVPTSSCTPGRVTASLVITFEMRSHVPDSCLVLLYPPDLRLPLSQLSMLIVITRFATMVSSLNPVQLPLRNITGATGTCNFEQDIFWKYSILDQL